jgi:hypothetical protein
MEPQLQSFLDNLIKSQLTDLKDSWANLHLEISEKVVNEVLAKMLATQRQTYPLLDKVSAAQVKGSIIVELKLHA